MEFFTCETCGNIIRFDKNVGIPLMCCGKKMIRLMPNEVEASFEKHIPVIMQKGNKVTVYVGSVLHPMVENHYIEWIILETKKGYTKTVLTPNDEPKAKFTINEDDEIVSAYAYCNIHGLWKSK